MLYDKTMIQKNHAECGIVFAEGSDLREFLVWGKGLKRNKIIRRKEVVFSSSNLRFKEQEKLSFFLFCDNEDLWCGQIDGKETALHSLTLALLKRPNHFDLGFDCSYQLKKKAKLE